MSLAALVFLAVTAVAFFVNWHRLSVDGFDGSLNDQVGYISVSRNFADHGTLDSDIIYPLLLRQHVRRNSIYMPGYYWTLAAFFKAFGYSATMARFPAIAAFLLSCWLTFWIAARLYSERAAVFATTLFAVFPFCLVYAFTAMMELPLIAAGLLAYALFLKSKGEQRPWVAAICLLLPFLFRETGAVVGVIMLAVVAGGMQSNANNRQRYSRVVVCALLILVILFAALYSPLGSGRPSLWKANLLVGDNLESVYGNAFATDTVSARLADWVHAIRENFSSNARSLIRPGGESAGFSEQSVLWFILSGIPVGLIMWFRNRDWFALGVAVSVALLLLADLCVYTVWGYRAMRVLLLLLPFVGMVWGNLLARVVKAMPPVETGAVGLLFLLGTWGAVHLIGSQAAVDEETKGNTAFLESVVGDDRNLVASPFWLSLDYVNEHYPQKWSFVPSNCETLRILDQRYPIGTIVVPQETTDDSPKPLPVESCDVPMAFVGTKEFNGSRFRIYRSAR